MSSRSLKTDVLKSAAVLAALLALAACGREATDERAAEPVAAGEPTAPQMTDLLPAGTKPPAIPAFARTFSGNAERIAAGKEYFGWYNCVGCHFHGAGGIGPAFLDHAWTYGGRIDQIYASIYDGRPNGMPAWGAIIPDEQIWEIAAYVESMPSDAPMPKGPPPAVMRRPGGLDANPPVTHKLEK